MLQSTFLSKYCFTSSVDHSTSFGPSPDESLLVAETPGAGIKKALASRAIPSDVDNMRSGLPSGVKI